MPAKKLYIGISGWTYPAWRGSFYPKGLKQKDELKYALSSFTSIEVNGTFYSLQRPKSFETWYDSAPKGFQFSIKGGQFITHVRRLRGVEDAVANFFAQGILALKEKLGPILWQLPPNFTFKDDRIAEFLELLPQTWKEASEIASRHTAKLDGRALVEVKGRGPIRHAVEVRHESFEDPKFFEILKKKNVALVMGHSGKEGWPYLEEATADFRYARLHGHEKKHSKGYSKAEIKTWFENSKKWQKNSDVFIYFDNKEKKTAPTNALEMMKLSGVKKKAA